MEKYKEYPFAYESSIPQITVERKKLVNGHTIEQTTITVLGKTLGECKKIYDKLSKETAQR